ncbi:MAG: hypothetical protein ACRC8S_16445 [Fimbriiglobus sp.]
MMRMCRGFLVAMLGFLACGGVSQASEPGVLKLEDNAGIFSSTGVQAAKDAFSGVKFQSPTHLNVVTFGKVPADKRSAFDRVKDSKNDKGRFFREWAEEYAKSHKTRGVVVLISMEGTYVIAIDDRETDLKRDFTKDDLTTLQDKLISGLGAGFKEKDQELKLKIHDAALLKAVSFVGDQLKNTSAGTSKSSSNSNTSTAAPNVKAEGGSGMMSYICIGIVALLGLWIVVGIVRSLMGGGGGGQYAQGGYGGGYGGGGFGGGGFMTGLMGGMLGAVAGNYLYNNFFGSSSTQASASDAGSTTGSTDSGAGDYDGGSSGSGGDFGGGDAGGGDFGGGGGDFGGGDFGGGGGDFGGGDW